MLVAAAVRTRRLSACRRGRKPRNLKELPSKPETAKALVTADAPGRATTGKPWREASATNSRPGSEMTGVPASDSRATSPCPKASITTGSRAILLASKKLTKRAFRPWWVSSLRAERVSSAATRPTSPSTRRARRVMSSKLPMGVATT